MTNVMFDTNIFNRILSQKINMKLIRGKFTCFVTHIQRDEINNTKNQNLKDRLNRLFNDLTSNSLTTESAVFDVSRWDQAKWTGDESLYIKIKNRLDSLNKKKKNNVQDSLISETAIKNNLELITDDEDLLTVTKEFSGITKRLSEFIENMKSK